MKVISFIAKNWNDILVVFLLIVSAITGLNQWIKKNGPIIKDMSVTERFAYITRLLTNLVPIALVLVTEAEIEFGSGTGKLKRSYVIDELYKRIPDDYKKYITEENLDAIINRALEEAENLWSANPDISRMVYGAPRGRLWNSGTKEEVVYEGSDAHQEIVARQKDRVLRGYGHSRTKEEVVNND